MALLPIDLPLYRGFIMNTDRPSILNKIVSQRQRRLQQNRLDISALKIEPSTRSLVAALESSSTGFIFECKQSSPSRGLLTKDYQPQLIAKQYQPFASAISVLTEPDFFAGSLQHLSKVRAAVSQPILCKDFVIETEQLYAARAAGADVILLMLSVVSDQFWQQCFVIAKALGLDIITEVHNQHELDRAIALPAKIIGINNRNLHSLTTDLSVTEALVTNIPSDRLIITESGISTHQQLLRLAPLVDGFLIGSSLMQSTAIDRALRKLIYGEIKICGLTRREDADLAWQLGASFGGLIFTPRSSRCISTEQAKIICHNQALPMVGVFLDQSISMVAETANQLGLKAVQLHGSESISDINQLRLLLTKGCEIWKTISCSETDSHYPAMNAALLLKNNWLRQSVDRVLIDTPKDSENHKLDVKDFLSDHKVMIAGGLTIDQPALSLSLPNTQAGFDLCSAIEASTGIKDLLKMKHLFAKLQPTTRKYHDIADQ